MSTKIFVDVSPKGGLPHEIGERTGENHPAGNREKGYPRRKWIHPPSRNPGRIRPCTLDDRCALFVGYNPWLYLRPSEGAYGARNLRQIRHDPGVVHRPTVRQGGAEHRRQLRGSRRRHQGMETSRRGREEEG